MKTIEELENKYIKLLLESCLSFKRSKTLFINISLKENIPFAEKVAEYAKNMGIKDTVINLEDEDEMHEYLLNTQLEDIVLNPKIDRSIWDHYAKMGAAMLFINSEVPGLMSDVPSDKITKMLKIRNETRKYYIDNVTKYNFSWCIAAVPNKRWAADIFKNSENSYNELYMKIFEMCMVDREDPKGEWEKLIKRSNELTKKLNDLEITDLYYKNSLGTNLHIVKQKDAKWQNIDEENDIAGRMIVNMPSYEIFTSPDCRKTEGIVYSSKPLINSGNIIDDFYLKFENGHVVDCGAKVGEEYLKKIIKDNANADLLGEIALVPYDSPISNTKIVYKTTLFDENASCHLAIGAGFEGVFGKELDKKTLENLGLNSSNIHIDFMIGTKDLEIIAMSRDGLIQIFKDGNFNI